ncbi:hypothetical protein HG530_011969 [Fusarium avenaceum]|nr:hypothetical protein HG530_011969 [Fusarium avenaceum]
MSRSRRIEIEPHMALARSNHQTLCSLSVSCLPLINLSLETTSALGLLNPVSKATVGLGATPSGHVTVKDGLNFFKGLPSGLRVGEECMEGHGDTKGAENHVRLPLDVGEGWWNKEGEGKVEAVEGSKADTLGAVLEGENFTGVDPGNGCPGLTFDTVDGVAVDSHDSSTGEVQDTTDQSSADEKRSTTETINEGKDKTGCDEEDNVLDDRGCEGSISSHSSHVEDVDEVVKHDIAAPEPIALPDTRREEAEIANVLGLTGNADGFADLFHLSDDDGAVEITTGVEVGKVEVSLLPAVVLGEPSGLGGVKLTPFDRPLLNTNNTTTNIRRRKLSEVHKNLRTRDTNSDTADDAANNQMGNILRRALESSTGDPEETGNHKSLSSTKAICDYTSDEGADEGSGRHRGCDAALFC